MSGKRQRSDLKEFDWICSDTKMSEEQRRAFSDDIHERKRSGQRGGKRNGDFTKKELREFAKAMMEEWNK